MVTVAKANHLIHETSPYLLQHAHNPVDWYAWGEEALERAQAEHKPIFLSIGYAACHWCHVMERESFEDEAIAQVLNDHFVSIKVDREERPDVDAIYMNAVQLMTGGGGWPLSVFLTPSGKPFFGGTYFPPHDRQGFPGFLHILEEIVRVWKEESEGVARTAEQLTAALRQFCDLGPRGRTDAELSRDILAVAFRQIAAQFDGDRGGFGRAPKFPQPTVLSFVLRYYKATGEPHALAIVETTLDHLARGGIFDQLGGGFHRYSTDNRWLIPHFEKMLNDNALLANFFLDAWRETGKPLYEKVVRETLGYVLREMTHPEGGFYTAQDADSQGLEGEFFIWSPEEITAVVGSENADVVMRHFGIEPIGNFEGAKSVLSVVATADEVARQVGRPVEEVEAALADARRKLFDVRCERVAPDTDDKIMTAWNGLMISAMARAGTALREPRHLAAARRSAEFVLTRLRREDGGLWRTWRRGEVRARGFLTDYAFLIGGLLDLYEATLEARWFVEAATLADIVIARFWDEREGGFYLTESGHEPLLVRPKDSFDGPEPSGNAATAAVLLRLAAMTGRESFRKEAVATLKLFAPAMVKAPLSTGHLLSALDFQTAPPVVVIVVGPPKHPETQALIEAARRPYLPNRVLLLADGNNSPAVERLRCLAPILEGKVAAGSDRPKAYVCRAQTCGAPTSDPEALARELSGGGRR